MPAPKRFTDEELRERKNAKSRERYRLDADHRAARAKYHAELHIKKKQANPEYLAELARARKAWRDANPEKDRAIAERSRKRNAASRNAATRKWFSENKEKRAAYQNARRAKICGAEIGDVPANYTEELMRLQRGKCACCKADLKTVKRNLDHIMPLALGGQHIKTNLQLLCQPCNNAKYAKHPIEFMQSRGLLL